MVSVRSRLKRLPLPKAEGRVVRPWGERGLNDRYSVNWDILSWRGEASAAATAVVWLALFTFLPFEGPKHGISDHDRLAERLDQLCFSSTSKWLHLNQA